jgi:hypothetical protein
MRHKLIGYIFKMAAQHPKLASDSLEKIPDNIAVSFPWIVSSQVTTK